MASPVVWPSRERMLHALLVNDVQDYCYEDMYEDLDDEEDTALFLYLALMLADDNDDTALRITEDTCLVEGSATNP